MGKRKDLIFIKLKWNGWDIVASPIDSVAELFDWLKDGSLEEDNIVIAVSKVYKVVKKRNKLELKEIDRENVEL